MYKTIHTSKRLKRGGGNTSGQVHISEVHNMQYLQHLFSIAQDSFDVTYKIHFTIVLLRFQRFLNLEVVLLFRLLGLSGHIQVTQVQYVPYHTEKCGLLSGQLCHVGGKTYVGGLWLDNVWSVSQLCTAVAVMCPTWSHMIAVFMHTGIFAKYIHIRNVKPAERTVA